MIKFARLGIAMGNATHSLKSVSAWITEDNENAGVAVAIERLLREGGTMGKR
jgi:hydroxymethylpyrimidine pyrophosphatase-like HAD family hydrolase